MKLKKRPSSIEKKPGPVMHHAPIVVHLDVERCKCVTAPPPHPSPSPNNWADGATAESVILEKRKSGEIWQLQQAWVMHGSTIRLPPVAVCRRSETQARATKDISNPRRMSSSGGVTTISRNEGQCGRNSMNDTCHQTSFVKALSVTAPPSDSDSSKNDFLGLPRRWITAKPAWNMDSIFASRLHNRSDVWMKAFLNRFSMAVPSAPTLAPPSHLQERRAAPSRCPKTCWVSQRAASVLANRMRRAH